MRTGIDEGMMKSARPCHKAVFLDRDGTIVFDDGYSRTVDDLKIIPGAAEAVRLLANAGFLLVIVTNQSAIARGYLTEETLHMLHEYLRKELELEGGRIEAVYYCPHHPEDRCLCRKPAPGLLKRACSELDIDVERSFLIGDQESDIHAARAVGCRAILVNSCTTDSACDYVAANLGDAAQWILREAQDDR